MTVENKVMLVLSMQAEHTGLVTLNRIAFEVDKETPKMYYRGDTIGEEIDDQYAGKVIGYRSQFHKSNLPERLNSNQYSTVIEFRIVDVCELEKVEKVVEMHTKELINKMEQELAKRKRLLDGWISTVTE